MMDTAGLLDWFLPEKAEAKAVDGFEKEYARAVRAGYPRSIYAGTLESKKAFEDAKKRERNVSKNQVYAKTHGGEARWATGEMEPEISAMHIANLLDSPFTLAMPNFPSTDPNKPKAMFYNNDGTPITTPFSGRRDGGIMLETIFEPTNTKRDFVERYLGRPTPSSIPGLTYNGASAQPLGLSAVEVPSTGECIPQEPGLEKPIIDPIDFIGGIPGAVIKKAPAVSSGILRLIMEGK